MADRGSRGSSSSNFLPLNEEEVLFGWRTLAQQGAITVPKVRQFMQDVCGVRMSIIQAKDLLNYMDMNGDGRVGQDDFRSFMATGRLSMTDSSTFMWRPKKLYQQKLKEQGKLSKESPEPDALDDEDTVAPMRKQPTSRPGKEKAGPSGEAAAGAAPQPGEKKPTAKQHDPKFLARVDAVLEKYESETWARLLEEEDKFLEELFKMFDKSGKGEELDAMAYHQMLSKWFPLANWCTSGNFRAPDTLAVINYLRERAGLKKDAKEGHESNVDAEAHAGTQKLPSIPFDVWLDVVNGKYRAEVTQTEESK